MPVEKQRFTDNTYSLAKGIHHINIAKQYFEDVRLGTTGDVKAVFNQYIQKCEWIISNLMDRLGPENKKSLQDELSSSIFIEAINDKLIHLNDEQKEFIENLLDSIISGEEIKVVKE
jgi:flagellin-specific chaperone FliS